MIIHSIITIDLFHIGFGMDKIICLVMFYMIGKSDNQFFYVYS